MTAPAQIASSASVPMAAPREPRGPRSQSDRASNTTGATGADETNKMSSSQDSSQAAASDEDGVSSGHSNFAAILRQQLRPLSGKSGSGIPSAEGARTQTGQQKDTKLDPATPAAVPVPTNEPHRVIAPLAFAMPTFKAEPDLNGTSANEPSQSESATFPSDTARTGSSSALTSPSGQASPSGQGGANQPPAPDALAFAARLTPPGAASAPEQTSADSATTNDAPAEATGTSFARQLAALKQALSSGVESPSVQGPGEKGGASAGGQLPTSNAAPLPPQLMNQGGNPSAAATSASSDPRPAFAPPAQRVEQVAEPPAAKPSSGHDITVRIPDATDRGTNVRFVERGSEVHVAVRTGDSELAQMLRGGLSDLSGRLSHNGIQAEVWRPGQDSSQSDSQNQSPDSRESGGRRNHSGAQSDGQDQPSENKPRWVEELEASIAAPAARSGL